MNNATPSPLYPRIARWFPFYSKCCDDRLAVCPDCGIAVCVFCMDACESCGTPVF